MTRIYKSGAGGALLVGSIERALERGDGLGRASEHEEGTADISAVELAGADNTAGREPNTFSPI